MNNKLYNDLSINENLFAEKYAKLVTKIARKYYLEGGDYDDLIQEGMIGLITAMRKYDRSKSDNFEAFAAMCIRRRIYDVIRDANSGNGKLDIVYTDFDSHTEYTNTLDDHDPEAMLLDRESAAEIEKALARLV